uniref:Uncharacterized protein n=1 Tax=Dicentrarchus labrax TaxID=13489 RepID=A0A8C4EM51_DICLA
MASSGLVGDFLSPESTVTSLLSSSGHLRSSLLAPEHNTTFRYRNKVHSAFARFFLRERLTDRELDFLNLPVSSLHHIGNRDRLSMTTDELLSIPYDGSMPVTHTSAFILSSSYPAPQLSHQNHPHPARTPRSSRFMLLQSAHRAARSECEEPSLSLHLPHWFTSNKTDMDCSGITSVPDIKYPAWIQRCDLSEPPPPAESELWDDHGTTWHHNTYCISFHVTEPTWRYRITSSFKTKKGADLEDDDGDQMPAQQTLRELRLQFAEQISLLAAEKKSSDIMETLFRDNRLESLIQKADQVLNSLSQSSGGAGSLADSVPSLLIEGLPTQQSVCAVLSNQSYGTLKPKGSSDRSRITALLFVCCLSQALGCCLHGNSIFKQPGPVEALKQMLFRLQAVEAELQRQQQASVAPMLTDRTQAEETPAKPVRTLTLQVASLNRKHVSLLMGKNIARV